MGGEVRHWCGRAAARGARTEELIHSARRPRQRREGRRFARGKAHLPGQEVVHVLCRGLLVHGQRAVAAGRCRLVTQSLGTSARVWCARVATAFTQRLHPRRVSLEKLAETARCRLLSSLDRPSCSTAMTYDPANSYHSRCAWRATRLHCSSERPRVVVSSSVLCVCCCTVSSGCLLPAGKTV